MSAPRTLVAGALCDFCKQPPKYPVAIRAASTMRSARRTSSTSRRAAPKFRPNLVDAPPRGRRDQCGPRQLSLIDISFEIDMVDVGSEPLWDFC